jgi:methylated-DNA-[protein]-cysteine S-methyltransferase
MDQLRFRNINISRFFAPEPQEQAIEVTYNRGLLRKGEGYVPEMRPSLKGRSMLKSPAFVLTAASRVEFQKSERICAQHVHPKKQEIVMTALRLYLEKIPAPPGTMLVLTDEEDRLRALDWEDYEARMHRLLRLHYGENNFVLSERGGRSNARHALEDYLAGDLLALDTIQVETGGTAFQREVWKTLRHISPGQTVGYGELAARIGKPKAVRAVGLANGANPVGVAVPCHRVIGANGSLTGYGGGLERKRWLLVHEGALLIA